MIIDIELFRITQLQVGNCVITRICVQLRHVSNINIGLPTIGTRGSEGETLLQFPLN